MPSSADTANDLATRMGENNSKGLHDPDAIARVDAAHLADEVSHRRPGSSTPEWPEFRLKKGEDPWEALERKSREIDLIAPGLRRKVWSSVIWIGTSILFAIALKWYVH